MRYIDISKKRKGRWPWLLGVVLLVLVLWGVTVLSRSDPDPEPEATVPTAADTLPPAMIPSQSQGAAPVREGTQADEVVDTTAGGSAAVPEDTGAVDPEDTGAVDPDGDTR